MKIEILERQLCSLFFLFYPKIPQIVNYSTAIYLDHGVIRYQFG